MEIEVCLHVTHGTSVFCFNNESSDHIRMIGHVRRQLLTSRLKLLYLHRHNSNNNNNNNNNNTRTMFMVLSSWLKVIARVHLVHAMNAGQRQTATDIWTKPMDLDCRLLGNHYPPSPFITQPKSWHSFYHPTEGRRLSRPRWLVRHWDSLPALKQSPIQVVTRPYTDQSKALMTTLCQHLWCLHVIAWFLNMF